MSFPSLDLSYQNDDGLSFSNQRWPTRQSQNLFFLHVLSIGDAYQNKRGLLTYCGDLLLKKFQQTSNMHDITNTIFAYELALTFKLVPSGDPEYLICTQDIAISYMLRYRLPGAGYASDLGQAISGYEIVVSGVPDTHRGMPIWLNNLSISIRADTPICGPRQLRRCSAKGS